MFNKTTIFTLSKDNTEIYSGELIKTASVKLPDGIEYDDDFLYMLVRAVSAGEYWGFNKNSDFFPEAELINGHKTFLTAHTFKNHENKDIKNAIGDVLTSSWNDKMKGIDLLLRIDRMIAPSITRGFEKNFMTDVSMGCRVEYTICSICGNKAKRKEEFCDHIKYMRGKILDNGKKVGEINIGPKFHDISTVLNGAERVAKATKIFIINDKIAFCNDEDSEMQKTASDNSFMNSMYEGKNDNNKIANEYDNISSHIIDNMEIFGIDKTAKLSKQAYMQKISEIKKDIQGNILNIAKGSFVNERFENAEELISILKLFYTKYWDIDKCSDIANKLKMIALKKNLPKEIVFDQFLKVLDFAGIELTPMEFHNIYHILNGSKIKFHKGLELKKTNISEARGFMDSIYKHTDTDPFNGSMNLVSLLKEVSHMIEPNVDKIMPKINVENPKRNLKAIIIKMNPGLPSVNKDIAYNDIMENVVGELMEGRSAHRRFLLKRASELSENSVEPNFENTNQFMPIFLSDSDKIMKTAEYLPYVLTDMMYSVYQNERVKLANSDMFEYCLLYTSPSPRDKRQSRMPSSA